MEVNVTVSHDKHASIFCNMNCKLYGTQYAFCTHMFNHYDREGL